MPSVDTRLCSKIFPKLKSPLSTLLGIPMDSILPIITRSGFICNRVSIRISFPKCVRPYTINAAAIILASSVGRATPTTPM